MPYASASGLLTRFTARPKYAHFTSARASIGDHLVGVNLLGEKRPRYGKAIEFWPSPFPHTLYAAEHTNWTEDEVHFNSAYPWTAYLEGRICSRKVASDGTVTLPWLPTPMTVKLESGVKGDFFLMSGSRIVMLEPRSPLSLVGQAPDWVKTLPVSSASAPAAPAPMPAVPTPTPTPTPRFGPSDPAANERWAAKKDQMGLGLGIAPRALQFVEAWRGRDPNIVKPPTSGAQLRVRYGGRR